MLSFLPGQIRGVIGMTLLVLNLLFWFLALLPSALIKIIFPIRIVRRPMDTMLNFFCTMWGVCNLLFLAMLNDIEWDVQGNDDLKMNDWYLMIANHQTWADIPVLQYALNNRIPYFRYFLKHELIWIPVFNFIWYSLDYPFMKRYSKKVLEKYPHLKGKDIETTRKSCLKFKNVPVSIMNFAEGTRFTPQKHKQQQSPFTYLLKPKAGGIAFALSAMGGLVSEI
ncbi:MAG: acetyltransferase [Pseudomonadota bacterium]